MKFDPSMPATCAAETPGHAIYRQAGAHFLVRKSDWAATETERPLAWLKAEEQVFMALRQARKAHQPTFGNARFPL